LLASYAYAVSEENASGGIVVTAPTCGACGVLPSVAKMYQEYFKYSDEEIINALATASLFGNIAKTNGSISGAEAGCQAEIGVACSMGAAMISTVYGDENENIAQAAEIGLEHSLGLTCDPVKGYVQVPCIERCAIFALKAISSSTLAKLIPASDSIVDFDTIVKTMYHTGKDIPQGYRETSVDGLAKHLNK
jgi:L-serine dehydratase